MDLIAFAQMVLRRGWIALALALLFALGGYAFARTRPQIYAAVTPVKIQPARPADLGQTQAIKEVMRSYEQDITTYDMGEAVRTRLCGDAGTVAQRLCARLDAGAVRGMIHVGSDANVYEIRIEARSADPAEAVKVSEQTAHAFVDQRDKANLQIDLRDRILAEVRDAPQPGLYSPRTKLIVGAALAVGLALGALLMLALEYLASAVIRDRHEAERLLAVSVLGTVPPANAASRDAGGGGGALPTRLVRDASGAARRAVRATWPIVVLALVGALSALVFSRVQATEYVARTRIAVEPALGSDWGRSQAIREITRALSRDIDTRRMAQAVSEALQLDEPPDALLKRTSVAEDVDVFEITIEVRDSGEAVARDISRTWAERFVEARRTANLELEQSDRILVRLRDRTTTEIWAPKTSANVLAGAVLGALLGAAALYLIHLLGAGTVRGVADAARATGATLVTPIPPVRRHG